MPAKNLVTKTTIDNLTAQLKGTFAKKSHLPTKVSDLTNDSNFQTGAQVESAISAALVGALKPSGSVTFANLPALSASVLNNMYNVTDAFTTTSDFVEGAGKSYPAGTNVAIINTGTVESPVYKYDSYTGTFDFSGFAEKVSGATNGHLAGLDANGNLTDSGKAPGDFALRDTDAVTNNIAKFDANGDPVDTGIAAGDVMTKVASATNGHLAGLNANGEATDSGVDAADVQTKLGSFTSGNVRTSDANGFAQDSGIAADDLLVDSDISDYTAEEIAALLADDAPAGE